MKTFAVDLRKIVVVVTTDGVTTTLPFKTKRHADKKITQLCAAGYKFDREWWSREQMRRASLHIQAHDLCNVLCDRLYNWNPEPDKAARLARILTKARARLARREHA